ncbi:subtilisin-like protein [Acephala macrosclerotiorum]|nr:subtilisin-like protein [Acephala macrosclerotiorum]
MKLGLQGVTMLFSSGDYGIAGNGNQCCASPQCSDGVYNDGTSGAFNLAFRPPALMSHPLATQIVPAADITALEEACKEVIYPGGGFSNVFSAPAYQSSALKHYFNHNSPDYTSLQYKNTQQSRGFPDISANGAKFPCTIKGQFYHCYRTSSSSPTVGSLITLINEQRIKAGKGPVGFVNPVLYANPGAMNDIKKGGNRGCGTTGFRAVTGWDPVTGLGMLDYEKLPEVFMNLP